MTRRHVTKTVPVIGAPGVALDISLFTEVRSTTSLDQRSPVDGYQIGRE